MILADTHVLLWSYLNDRRLSARSRALISESERVYYSSVSIAEIVIKHMLGRLPLPGGDRFPGVFDEMGLIELPFAVRHADAIRAVVGLKRHDPFDRFLIAQAYADRLTFLTADRALLATGQPWMADARV